MGGKYSYPMQQLSRDRIVVITGANSGVGYEIAKWCAMMGATVIMACRSEERARDAITKMNEEFRDLKSKGTEGIADYDSLALEFMPLDLGSLKSVKQFCEDFKKSGRPLHVFFGNAGLGMAPFRKTEDDFEETLQVNYLGHFIIIAKLLHIMLKSGPDCRILLMSSIAHQFASFDLNTINYSGPPESFPNMNYYGRSKLYQVMQIATMARRLEGKNITCFAIHPGWVDTRFGEEGKSGVFPYFQKMGDWFGLKKTAPDSAKCSIDLSTNPKYAGNTGSYWANGPATASREARNKDKQEALWKKTFELIREHLTQEENDAMEGKINA